MEPTLSNLVVCLLSFLALLITRLLQRFLSKQTENIERNGTLGVLDTLADMAVHEIERLTQSKEKEIKGNDKKQEAAKLLMKLLKDVLPDKQIKKLKLSEDSKLVQGAIERKAQNLPQ